MPTPMWDQIEARLETERLAIHKEIGEYPPPITGCDAQFNYLLEQRDKISRELRDLNTLHPDAVGELEKFIQTSSFVADLKDA